MPGVCPHRTRIGVRLTHHTLPKLLLIILPIHVNSQPVLIICLSLFFFSFTFTSFSLKKQISITGFSVKEHRFPANQTDVAYMNTNCRDGRTNIASLWFIEYLAGKIEGRRDSLSRHTLLSLPPATG